MSKTSLKAENHFPGVRKMVSIGSNKERETQDYHMTRET